MSPFPLFFFPVTVCLSVFPNTIVGLWSHSPSSPVAHLRPHASFIFFLYLFFSAQVIGKDKYLHPGQTLIICNFSWLDSVPAVHLFPASRPNVTEIPGLVLGFTLHSLFRLPWETDLHTVEVQKLPKQVMENSFFNICWEITCFHKLIFSPCVVEWPNSD